MLKRFLKILALLLHVGRLIRPSRAAEPTDKGVKSQRIVKQ